MEVVAARPACRFVHELRLPRLVDRVEKKVVRDLAEGLQNVEVELPAEDGGEGERAHARLAQSRHAPEDDVPNPLRQARRQTRFVEMAEHLPDEERIAAGALGNLACEARRDVRRAERLGQPANLAGSRPVRATRVTDDSRRKSARSSPSGCPAVTSPSR